MPEAVRTCPVCLMKVLPTPDGRCPSCRNHTFGATSDALAAEAVKATRAKQLSELRRAAVLYWRTWKLVALQWALVAVYFGLEWIWPGDAAETDSGLRWAQIATEVSVVAVGMALFATTRELSRWLEPAGGPMRSVVSSIPGGNILAVLMFTKEVAREFENKGLVVLGLGPRLREIPSS